MVKAVNIILGFVLFSLFLSMFFAFIGETMVENNIGGAAKFLDLSGQYKGFTEKELQENETLRQMLETTKVGTATSEDQTNFLVSGAVASGRNSFNIFSVWEKLILTAQADAGEVDNYIDKRIINGGLVILLTISIFVVLHYLRGAKLET